MKRHLIVANEIILIDPCFYFISTLYFSIRLFSFSGGPFHNRRLLLANHVVIGGSFLQIILYLVPSSLIATRETRFNYTYTSNA